MPDDLWDRDELGRDIRPGDLLDRHLNRVGARQAAHQDSAAHLQLNMLRMLLDVVHSACDDEQLDPETLDPGHPIGASSTIDDGHTPECDRRGRARGRRR